MESYSQFGCVSDRAFGPLAPRMPGRVKNINQSSGRPPQASESKRTQVGRSHLRISGTVHPFSADLSPTYPVDPLELPEVSNAALGPSPAPRDFLTKCVRNVNTSSLFCNSSTLMYLRLLLQGRVPMEQCVPGSCSTGASSRHQQF